MRKKARAARFAIGAVVSLIAGCVMGVAFPGTYLLWVFAGFVGYVACGSRAMAFWKMDEKIFVQPAKHYSKSLAKPRLIALWLLLGALAVPAKAQQTLFNVPSADVLDRGKTYFETDALWRPQESNFAVYAGRGVYGFGINLEAGVNFGGFVSPGRSVPVATPNIKWRPWQGDQLAVTTGVFGLFFLRGSEDGKPAALGYAHLAYKLPTNTRITAGGYWGSSGYAAADSRAGALLGFEQRVNDHLNLLADWFSGKNGLGYFTPGVSSTWGHWTLYAGYSLKNGDSKGNAMLLELGFLL